MRFGGKRGVGDSQNVPPEKHTCLRWSAFSCCLSAAKQEAQGLFRILTQRQQSCVPLLLPLLVSVSRLYLAGTAPAHTYIYIYMYKCPLLTTTGLNSSKSWMLITCSFRRFKQKGMEMLRHLEQVVSTQNSAQTSSKFSLHLGQSTAFRLALTLLLFKSCPSPSSHTCIIIRTSKTNDIRHSSEKLDTPLGLTEVVLF